MNDKPETQKEIEKQPIKADDAQKAKRKGNLFGDPIFVVE